MSSYGSSSSSLSLDHLPPPEHLCYVHCSLCNTVLAVSVPTTSWLKTVTVRCGHCSHLLPINPATNHLHLANNQFSPSPQNLVVERKQNSVPSSSLGQPSTGANYMSSDSIQRPPISTIRPPEKRQRMPSAYNRFIKAEIQRIKAANPHISHREAFSAAAKNWAHFPHIHFGMMPEHR